MGQSKWVKENLEWEKIVPGLVYKRCDKCERQTQHVNDKCKWCFNLQSAPFVKEESIKKFSKIVLDESIIEDQPITKKEFSNNNSGIQQLKRMLNYHLKRVSYFESQINSFTEKKQ